MSRLTHSKGLEFKYNSTIALAVRQPRDSTRSFPYSLSKAEARRLLTNIVGTERALTNDEPAFDICFQP